MKHKTLNVLEEGKLLRSDSFCLRQIYYHIVFSTKNRLPVLHIEKRKHKKETFVEREEGVDFDEKYLQ